MTLKFQIRAIMVLKMFRQELINRLTYLINNDFEKLLWILYRIDVNEKTAVDVLSDKQKRIQLNALLILLFKDKYKKLNLD